MARKKYFMIIDTETTQTDKVVDFGAIVVDKKGNIQTSCAILVREMFNDPENHPLFHFSGSDPLWGRARLPERYKAYADMLDNGSRMLASVNAVNRWLARANAEYQPIVTAYNKAFDYGKMANTGIDISQFEKSFCLWHAAAAKWGHTRAFREFVLQSVAFNPPTDKGNMSYVTNAEIMARFVLGQPDLPNEPHTAFEDALLYELPILTALVKNTPPAEYMNPPGYNWREFQVKDWFAVK